MLYGLPVQLTQGASVGDRQLDKIWEVGRGSAARVVYLWTVAELLTPEEALLCNLVVMMDACPPGRYPHNLGREWRSSGFNCDEAREWIRAGVLDPEEACQLRSSGYAPGEHRTHPRIAVVG